MNKKEELIDRLFKEINSTAYHKFEEQNFDDVGKAHDWRNHVPEEIIEVWNDLSDMERKLMFIMCEPMADREEWD